MTDATALDTPRLALPDDVRRFLLDRLRFATIATISPDGSPHLAVVWFDVRESPADGTRILLNSAEGRRWPANLRRDPRLSFGVEDGYDWVRVSGRVEIVDDQEQAQADIAALARRYHHAELEKAERAIREFRRQRRVSFLLRPASVHAEFDED